MISEELIAKIANKLANIAGRSFIKYYVLFKLVQLGLATLGFAVGFAVTMLMLNVLFNNIPVPKVDVP